MLCSQVDDLGGEAWVLAHLVKNTPWQTHPVNPGRLRPHVPKRVKTCTHCHVRPASQSRVLVWQNCGSGAEKRRGFDCGTLSHSLGHGGGAHNCSTVGVQCEGGAWAGVGGRGEFCHRSHPSPLSPATGSGSSLKRSAYTASSPSCTRSVLEPYIRVFGGHGINAHESTSQNSGVFGAYCGAHGGGTVWFAEG
ncbi:hypothetical protein BDZ91DRAFT_782586 [Kalaharituber pfeilii]|nr:hypothetical protein BDZ91DRAFT_782586 [Kalaharituber pfeilii]